MEEGIISVGPRRWLIEIETTDWVSGKYIATLDNIDLATYIDVSVEEGHDYINTEIEWETKDGVIEFSTETIPSDTISLNVVAWGTETYTATAERATYTISIPVSSWIGNSPYTYTYTATGMTAAKELGYTMNSGADSLQSAITVTAGAGTLTFSTAVKPTNTITITIFVL
jgi:hypothetical protein